MPANTIVLTEQHNMADQENLCVVLNGVKDLQLENRSIPKPKTGEVLIAMRMVGICCSDVHYYQKGRIGDYIVKSPMVMGHEGSGVVTALGEGVTNLKVGDRVTIEPGVPCRRCEFCKRGSYNLCPHVTFCATPPDDGNMCRYYCQSADFVYKIPDNMTWQQAALCEPVSVAISACRRANVGVGQEVLIIGAGPIGLLSAMVARASGACRVALVDVLPARLDFAEKALGKDIGLYLADPKTPSKQMAEEIVDKAFTGRQPNATIECSGAESGIQTAIYATKSGGVVMLVGMGQPMINVPLIEALCREVDIRGMFRYANTYPTAVSLIGSGKVDATKLVTHCIPLEEGIKAYEISANPAKTGAVKVLVNCEAGGNCDIY